jgi:hypothetical protein
LPAVAIVTGPVATAWLIAIAVEFRRFRAAPGDGSAAADQFDAALVTLVMLARA